MSNFGTRLRNLRIDAGLTQAELAEKLCLKKSIISAYERERRKPPEATLVKLANFFSVTTDWLLGLDERTEVLDLTGFDEKEIRLIRHFIASLRR